MGRAGAPFAQPRAPVAGLTLIEQPARFDDLADARTAMLRRAIAHAHALRHELRDSDAAADVAPWLAPAELSAR